MKVFFSQPEFDSQLLRALTYAPVGGADLGESLTTAAKIKEGDFDSWHQEWTILADKTAATGEASEQAGHEWSACQAFLRASNYYRTSYFFLGAEPVDNRVISAYEQHAVCFEKALRFLPYDVCSVAIPYGQITLPGYFFRPRNNERVRPTILTFPGYDSSRQECYFGVAKSALDRGLNVLCIDGPGQGELLIKKQIPMTHEWDQVVAPAVDYLRSHESVNPDAIILVGTSWGGMLAPLAAAKEQRIAALVASPGQYDALESIKKALPNVEELLAAGDYTVLDQILSRILADKMVAAKFKYKMWVHGVSTACDLLKVWASYSMAATAAQITCPTLVMDYENEHFSTGQARQLFDALTCPKSYILCKNGEGAGEHCGMGALTLVNQRIFDWIEETLKSGLLAASH